MEKGGADVQERNATTGWVALHEAAFRGHAECIKVCVCVYLCVCVVVGVVFSACIFVHDMNLAAVSCGQYH